MTAIDTTQLQNLANLTLEDFKALHLQGQNRANVYYTALKLEAQDNGLLFVENYAALAQNVVNDESVNGQLANKFTSTYAEAAPTPIDFSPGSDARLEMQFELMKADVNARVLAIQAGGTGELNFDDTITIHTTALSAIGLPPEAFSLYTPLIILAEHDPERAQFLFQTVTADKGVYDVIQDGLLLGFGANISSAQSLSDILKDYGAQAQWLNATLEAMQDFVVDNAGSQDAIEITGRIETYQQLLNLAGGAFDNVADWVEWAANTVQNTYMLLPSWYQNTQTWFGVEITGFWDPLVIDTDGDGLAADYIERTLINNGTNAVYPTMFDLDGDGFATATAWHGDAFLARDLNANGRIDNGLELFGNATQNGFAALAAFDSNADGKIDFVDAIWDDLILWKDFNHDGQTQSDELFSMASQNITAINLAATNLGNQAGLTHTGTVTTTTGTLAAGSYVFEQRADNTRYTADYIFDLRAAFLPNMRGFNHLPELSVALSLDNNSNDSGSLMALMQSLTSYSITDMFENWSAVGATIENILFRWAGVDNIDPASRGIYLKDARQLGFVEEYLGQGFVDRNEWGTNPGSVQAKEFQQLWDTFLFPQLKASILSQTVAAELFISGDVVYDFTDSQAALTGSGFTLSQDVLDTLEAAAAALSTTAERQAFWVGVTDFLDSFIFLDVSDFRGWSAEEAKLAVAIAASDSNLVWAESGHDPDNGITSIEYRYFNPFGETIMGDADANDWTVDSQYFGTADADIMVGLGGADNLNGGNGDDTIYGHTADGSGDDGAADILYGNGGNDVLYGGLGNDALYGGSGNDHLIGGDGDDLLRDGGGTTGQDLLEGGAGNDDYYVITDLDSNHDLYVLDSNGYDEIYLPNTSAFLLSNATFERYQNSDLRIWGFGSGNFSHYDIFIADQFSELNDTNGVGIERMRFQTGAYSFTDNWIDLKSFLLNYSGVIKTNGSEQPDEIYGILTGSADDLIYAKGGDDLLYGDAGNDTIYGGTGNDEIYGGEGDDIIYAYQAANELWFDEKLYGGEGNDTIYGYGELFGGTGNDVLNGKGILDGGMGDDVLYAAAITTNTDNIIFIASPGNDTIHGTMRPEFKEIIRFNTASLGDLIFERTGIGGNDLIITHPEGKITVYGQFTHPGININSKTPNINELYFSNDGTTIKVEDISYTTYGTDGADTINGIQFGGGPDDVIYGYAGNDVIQAFEGNNTIYAGDGDDYVRGGSNDYIEGGAGNDTLRGEYGTDVIYGGEGDDYIYSGNSSSHSERNGDNLFGDSGNDWIYGSYGNDVISGGDGNDSLTGYEGNDILDGGAGNDILNGYLGNDIYHYISGMDTVNETGGTDILKFDISIHVDDLSFVKDGFYAKIILQQGVDEISMDRRFNSNYSAMNYRIDTLEFFDGFMLNWSWFNDGSWAGNQNGHLNYIILGLSSNDALHGDVGDDSIHGRSGDDFVYGESGNDQVHGGDGNDTVDGGSGDDKLWGGSGINILIGGAGNDILNGDGGIDTASYSSALGSVLVNLLAGTAIGDGNDTLISIENVLGSANDDTLTGDGNANKLNGGVGDDSISGNDGDDILIGGAGNDTLDGGNGMDTVSYENAAAGIAANLQSQISSNDGDGGSDAFISIEHIVGSAYNDAIYGSTGINIIRGGAGNDDLRGYGDDDTLYGDEGNDLIYGTATGNETIYGGDGNDTINAYAGNDTIFGGAGNDSIYSTGDAQLDGEAGVNKIYFTGESYGVTANLTTNIMSNTNGSSGSIANFTVIYGSDYADEFTGTSGAETISGRNGNDTIYGESGNDDLYGDGGNDTLYGGSGNDYLRGHAGTDTLYGDDGDDVLYGYEDADTLYGGTGADYLYGMDADDVIHGGDGNDRLYGDKVNSGDTWSGNDVLYGDAGNDIISAHDGTDTIYGGTGADTISGGNDADTIIWLSGDIDGSVDTITDFSISDGDKIDVSDVLSLYDPLNDLLSDYLQITEEVSNTRIWIDAAGSGTFNSTADFVVLTGVTNILSGGNGSISSEIELQSLVSGGTLVA